MNRKRFILLLVITAIIISSIIIFLSYIKAKNSNKTNNEISIKGKVVYINLEGGFYGIVGDDGKNYLPINLSKEFKLVEGEKVRIWGKVREDIVTIYMWGIPIEITKIETLK